MHTVHALYIQYFTVYTLHSSISLPNTNTYLLSPTIHLSPSHPSHLFTSVDAKRDGVEEASLHKILQGWAVELLLGRCQFLFLNTNTTQAVFTDANTIKENKQNTSSYALIEGT